MSKDSQPLDNVDYLELAHVYKSFVSDASKTAWWASASNRTLAGVAILGFLVTIGGGLWYIAHTMGGFEKSLLDVKSDIETSLADFKSDIKEIDRKIEKLDDKVDGLDRRLSTIEGKITHLSNEKKIETSVSIRH